MPLMEFAGWTILVAGILGGVGYVMYGYLQGWWSHQDRASKTRKALGSVEARDRVLKVCMLYALLCVLVGCGLALHSSGWQTGFQTCSRIHDSEHTLGKEGRK